MPRTGSRPVVAVVVGLTLCSAQAGVGKCAALGHMAWAGIATTGLIPGRAAVPQDPTAPRTPPPGQTVPPAGQPELLGPESALPGTGPATAIDIYRNSCVDCHDHDGKGGLVRDVFPKVPDFTDVRWHAMKSDAELSRSILEGKGKSMPRMKEKLGTVSVQQMIAFVRAFRGGKQIVADLAETSEVAALADRPPTAGEPRGKAPASPRNDQRIAAGARLFRRHCAMCHSSDGKGTETRSSLPAIPDFTRLQWQESRTDPQLTVSVLDGKGTGMPPFQSKLTRQQARDIVRFIRTFAPGYTVQSVAGSSAFDAEFGRLTREFEDLRQQLRSLSAPCAAEPASPPTAPPPKEIRR